MAAGSSVGDLLMKTGTFETDTARASKALKQFKKDNPELPPEELRAIKRLAVGEVATLGGGAPGVYRIKRVPSSGAGRAAKAGVRRLSTMKGYAYEYFGGGDPLRGSDELWDMVVVDAMPGQLVGKRKIDGAEHYVLRVGDQGQSRKHYYAQTTASLK